MKKAIIIIPTYNEAGNIETTLEAVFKIFTQINEWEMHVLVVDDTSPDKTYEVVQKLQQQKKYSSKLHLLINLKKSGLGGAYLAGMKEAFGKLKADLVFEFDADLSHDPTKIPLLLKKIDDGYDMALGSRYVPGGGIPSNWGWHRKLLSRLGNITIMVVFFNFSIRDWTAGYRAITKPVYLAVHEELTSDQFSGYTFQIGFLYKAIQKGFKVAEVPYKFKDRTHGHSKMGPEYMKNTLLYIFKVRIKEILNHRIFKFLVVGGTGTLVQLIALHFIRIVIPDFTWGLLTGFILSTFLSIEIALASNFLLNNMWTFKDRVIHISRWPKKFLQFNVTSAGSILIQLIIATIGEKVFGLFTLFIIPFIEMPFDSGTLYVMIGIVIGLFWNFFAYNKFIWKKK